MAYNRRYILEKIVEIQNTVLEYSKKGASQAWIYRNVIRPKFFISYGTFKEYMTRNAKRELKELNENENL
ncbi:MAG: hypothetical protein LBL04_14020 [Bacteroidales bacterium]|jgi:hypothetical protein|nr:hypothetical protein [Bacteroidales bacterium]